MHRNESQKRNISSITLHFYIIDVLLRDTFAQKLLMYGSILGDQSVIKTITSHSCRICYQNLVTYKFYQKLRIMYDKREE